jgi:SAM-dependent methyltransferase
MNGLRDQWETRAVRSSSSLSGVLFQGLSEQANSVLHYWHAWIVRNVFLPKLQAGARVLDLGCGYGRLSRIIAAERPDIQLIGQDLAMPYCQTFAKGCGPCVLADAGSPPFADESFDGIISITCLMYLPEAELAHALESLRKTLRRGGVFLSVEPGYEVQQLIARARGGASQSPTGGLGFSRKRYRRAFERASYTITDAGGNTYLSAALLVPGIARSDASCIAKMLGRLGGADHRRNGYSFFALHRWIAAEKSVT